MKERKPDFGETGFYFLPMIVLKKHIRIYSAMSFWLGLEIVGKKVIYLWK